jgi:hypothetical protein
MDFSALIPELAKSGIVVLILGFIGWVLWNWGSSGNEKRIDELKENNKLVADLARQSAEAITNHSIANNRQSDIIANQGAALNNVVERLNRIESILDRRNV